MRVSEFDDLEYSALLTGSKQRSWLWFGLIVSLALHAALCTYFYRTRFQSLDAVLAEMQQTPTFKIKNVDLAQQLDKSSMDQTNAAAKPNPDQTQEQLPDEKKSFDKLLQEVQASTAMPDDTRDVLPAQPKDAPRASAIWSSCLRRRARSVRERNCACRTISFSNTTAQHCNRAQSGNCKSSARSSSATRERRLQSKVTLIHSAGRNTISI